MVSVTENNEAEKGMDCKSCVCGSYRHCETSLRESYSKAKNTQVSPTWEPNNQNLDFGPRAQHGGGLPLLAHWDYKAVTFSYSIFQVKRNIQGCPSRSPNSASPVYVHTSPFLCPLRKIKQTPPSLFSPYLFIELCRLH